MTISEAVFGFCLILFGLIEFVLRFVLILAVVCTVIGIALLFENMNGVTDFLKPYLWELLEDL